MEFDEIKRELQEHFGDGLAVVVGSGLSCAEGLPGMRELADHLAVVLPDRLKAAEKSEWSDIEQAVRLQGLEAALSEFDISDALEVEVVKGVIEVLEPAESRVLAETMSGVRTLRFTRLVEHLLKPEQGIPILTTNYDRLVEAACEAGRLPVDTMFDGATFGWHDEHETRAGLLRAVGFHGKLVRKRRRKHARIFKPHGSMDWYESPNGPIRYSGSLDGSRLMIAPGRKKLRKGYDSPFDIHREKANRLLDAAACFLVIGYGFNDDHLETHLSKRISDGVRTLILTRELSERARSLVETSASVIAIEWGTEASSRVHVNNSHMEVPIPNLWDLDTFINKVLEP